MDKSLYDIVSDELNFVQGLLEYDGEMTPGIQEKYFLIELEKKDKADGYYFIFERLKLERERFNETAKKFKKAAETMQNAADRLKENMKDAMLRLETQDFEGNEFRFKLAKSKPKLIIYDDAAVPLTYLKENIVYTIDTKLIEQDMKKGKQVPGAKLEESYSLRSYVNKGIKDDRKPIDNKKTE